MKAVNQTERRNAFLRFLLVFVLGMLLTGFGVMRYKSISELEMKRLEEEYKVLAKEKQQADSTKMADSLQINRWANMVEDLDSMRVELVRKQTEWKRAMVDGTDEAFRLKNGIDLIEQEFGAARSRKSEMVSSNQADLLAINESLDNCFKEIFTLLSTERGQMEKRLQTEDKQALVEEIQQLEKQQQNNDSQNTCQEKLERLQRQLQTTIASLEKHGADLIQQSTNVQTYISTDLKGISLRDEKIVLNNKINDLKLLGGKLETLAAQLKTL